MGAMRVLVALCLVACVCAVSPSNSSSAVHSEDSTMAWRAEYSTDNHTFSSFGIVDGHLWAITGTGKFPLDSKADKTVHAPTKEQRDELERYFKAKEIRVPHKEPVANATPSLHATAAPVPAIPTLPNLCHTPDSHFLTQWQSAIQNQDQRRTSSAFAVVAAVEAAYRRTKGRTVHLSEQFANWVTVSTNQHNDSKTCSYWGGGNSHLAVRAMHTYGVPARYEAKYKTEAEMKGLLSSISGVDAIPNHTASMEVIDKFEYSDLYISKRARFKAKFGVKKYLQLWRNDVRNPCRMEQLLSSNHEVIVDLKLDWQLKGDVLNFNNSHDINHGMDNYHTALVVGYNKHAGVFLLKNSWGGDRFVKVSYYFMSQAAVSGAVVLSVTEPASKASYHRRVGNSFLGKWHTDFNGHHARLVLRSLSTQRLVKGTFYDSGKEFVVKGDLSATEGKRAFNMIIDDSTKYKFYIHRQARGFASGISRGSTVYGAILSREKITKHPVTHINGTFTLQNVQGIWKLTMDGGYTGKLQLGPHVSSHTLEGGHKRLIQAKLQAPDFVTRYASGVVMYKNGYGSDGHSVRATVDLSPGGPSKLEKLHLYVHTHEDRILSGWARGPEGDIVGVIGYKQEPVVVLHK